MWRVGNKEAPNTITGQFSLKRESLWQQKRQISHSQCKIKLTEKKHYISRAKALELYRRRIQDPNWVGAPF